MPSCHPDRNNILLVGLLVGSSVLDWLPQAHLRQFEPLLKLAMALVLFNLGCEFTFTKFRRVAAHCLVLSAGEIFATFSLVLIGLLIFGCSGSIALLLGCLAVATAPATTILFQAETDDCIPVVTRVEPQELVGVVRRSDVVHALITQRRKSK